MPSQYADPFSALHTEKYTDWVFWPFQFDRKKHKDRKTIVSKEHFESVTDFFTKFYLL